MKAEQAAANTHQAALDLAQSLVGDLRGLKACDVPCGRGSMSARLASAGVDVTGVDVEAAADYLGDASRRVLHDVDQGLPFPEKSFDVVFSIEGIEHLENPSAFLRECARVLRPAGWLFVTTPNVDSLRSRWVTFTRGHPRYFGPTGVGSKEQGHLHPIDMVLMHGAAQRAGLTIVGTTVNRIVGKTWWKELLRPRLTRKLPPAMRNEIPFYGDVAIYAMRKGP
jgi:SAM-dependent methyltransferase